MKTIQAVVVLYKETIMGSPTCAAMLEAMRCQAGVREHVELLVADNSPEAQAVPDGFPGRYVHDGRNPGVANRYNMALGAAAEQDMRWLLLLDQDTWVTEAYLEEVVRLSVELGSNGQVVAVVPKLVGGGNLESPHLPQFRRSSFTVDLNSRGVMPGTVRAYNSGALLRVSALQAIGGFPEAYWLDYLDHAVFAKLQARGGKVYVMDARIEHEMSIYAADKERNPAYPARHRNQLAAASQFYREFGSARERFGHRVNLLRQAIGTGRRGHFAASRRLLAAALSLESGSAVKR